MKDFIGRAASREREARRICRAPERESVFARVFRCVVCDRQRPDEQRREPGSEVCVKCVEEAGFFEE